MSGGGLAFWIFTVVLWVWPIFIEYLNSSTYREPRPPRPIVEPGNVAVWTGYEWIEVCDTCGGNCGQCGTSIDAGMPPSMDRLIQHISE